MTAQDRPFVALTGKQFCLWDPKCLRKCERKAKPGHTCGEQPCHTGVCWPRSKED